MSVRLRPYRPADLAGVREVCVRTGDAGDDATGTLPDVGILPDLFAEPYVRLQPELATVAAVGERIVGYVVGTADTDAFHRAWRRQWLPVAARRHPAPASDPASAAERLVHLLHHPETLRTRHVDTYPAHLHVDLLPEAQGQGLGRALVEGFCAAVGARGAAGVHLGVAAGNTGAAAFYRRLGFRVLETTADATWFGLRC